MAMAETDVNDAAFAVVLQPCCREIAVVAADLVAFVHVRPRDIQPHENALLVTAVRLLHLVDLLVDGERDATPAAHQRMACVNQFDANGFAPRMQVEITAHHLAIFRPCVEGVNGGMDAEDALPFLACEIQQTIAKAHLTGLRLVTLLAGGHFRVIDATDRQTARVVVQKDDIELFQMFGLERARVIRHFRHREGSRRLADNLQRLRGERDGRMVEAFRIHEHQYFARLRGLHCRDFRAGLFHAGDFRFARLRLFVLRMPQQRENHQRRYHELFHKILPLYRIND